MFWPVFGAGFGTVGEWTAGKIMAGCGPPFLDLSQIASHNNTSPALLQEAKVPVDRLGLGKETNMDLFEATTDI